MTAPQSRPLPLHTIVTLLCIVSGSLDAIAFLALGEAFASVMTGNIVFMGVAAGTQNSELAIFCGIAIVGYIVGVVFGSWLVSHWTTTPKGEIWPAQVTKTLYVQLAILAAASIAWISLGGDISHHVGMVFLAIASGVMGIQGSAIRGLGVRVSTTYMTGALTTLLEAIVTRRPFTGTESTAARGLLALATGALLGSLVLTHASVAAMLVPTASLAMVLLIHFVYGRLTPAAAEATAAELA